MSNAPVPRPSPTPGSVPEDLEFLAQRLRLFGRFGASTSLAALALRVLLASTFDTWSLQNPLSLVWHTSAMLVFAVMAGLATRIPQTRGALLTLDLGGFALGAGFLLLMVAFIPFPAGPNVIGTMLVLFVTLSRAVFVPSTATRTAILAGMLVVPHLAAVYLRSYRASETSSILALWAEFGLFTSSRSPRGFALSATIVQAIWCTFTTALAMATSRVTFGLRAEMRSMKKMGQYTLVEKVGEGGMGIVYRARHALLRRPTAVKVLPPERAGATAIARFEREVQRTAELTHPSTITVYDYGRTPTGLFYYAMEYLEGATLDDLVAVDGAQPEARVVHILRGVSAALIEAHARGLIHRDIKPANVMLVEQGGTLDVPKVLDFGLVKEITSEASPALSGVDVLTGTPQYLAPESVTDPDAVSARSDIYALGAVAYYLLTGTHLFRGDSVVEICSHHIHSAPEPMATRRDATRGEVNPALEALVMRCLEKRPEARFDSAQSLHDTLAELPGGWSPADALAWWDAHGDQVRARRLHAPVSPDAETIAVQR